MKNSITLLLILIHFACYAQKKQKSLDSTYGKINKINIDSAKTTKVDVNQSGSKSLKSSDISAKNGEGNEIVVHQDDTDNKVEEPQPEKSNIKKISEDSNMIVGSLISIATFIGLIWAGYQAWKRRNKQE